MVKWTIAIPSVPARRILRTRLLDVIDPQVAEYDDIELLILEDNRMRDLGPKRQALIDIAQGEYISFIDDDDLVAEDYVNTIYPLLRNVDCVGFTGQISIEGAPWKDVFYSKDNGWEETSEGYLRPPQHLTPVKTELVKQIPYTGHSREDFEWAEAMKNAGLLKTENVTTKKLYQYFATSKYNRTGVWV